MSETIIIESNREIAYKEQLTSLHNAKENEVNTELPNNIWNTRLESGISVDVGDQISVEAVMINTRGSPDETIEFSGQNALTSPTDKQDNKVRMTFQTYITNRQQFNCNLPLLGASTQIINSQQGNYGYITFDDFTQFRKNFPYRGLEGMYNSGENPAAPVWQEVNDGGVFTNPPQPLDDTTPERMYLGTSNFIGYGNVINSIDSGAWDYKTHDIDLEVETGFNTPSKIGESLTAQLHQRSGNPVNWDELDEPAVVYSLVDSKILSRPNPAITDASYRTASTCTGDIFNARIAGKWGAVIAGESGTEGDGYDEEQGRDVFHQNLLCANPEEYRNVYGWVVGRKTAASSATLLTGGWETKGLYTGNSFINASDVGNYGLNCVIMEALNWLTVNNTSFTYNITKTSVGPILTTMNYLHIQEYNQLVTTNLIYSRENINNLSVGWSDCELIVGDSTPLIPDNLSNLDYYQNLYYGRASDQLSCGATGCKINITNTAQYLSAGVTEPSYQTINGKKTLIRRNGQGAWNSREELRYYSRYDDSFDQTKPNHMIFSFPEDSFFTLTDSNGQYYTQIYSKNNNIAVIPCFYKEANLPDPALKDVAFCAFIMIDKVQPDPALTGYIGVQMPSPMRGEFFGRSPSCYDNKLAKIITTQKTTVDTSASTKNSYPVGSSELLSRTYQYMPYIMVGADNPNISFDDTYGRFTISGLHTALRVGNGVFQDAYTTREANAQGEEISMSVNAREAAICGSSGTDGSKTSYADIVQNSVYNPIISTISGISISAIRLFTKNNQADSIPLSPTQPIAYNNCLFDKLGFELEQLIPYIGQRQSQFNRGTYNKYLGNTQTLYNKLQTMVKPFTTNAYISGADALSMVENTSKLPMLNLGGIQPNIPIFVNAVSDSLVAVNLPSKLDYSYLVVYSNIIQGQQFYGGANGSQKVPAICYASRSFASGDFFFVVGTSLSYTVDKPYVITNFDTNITLPNGLPAPIEKNSSIIYKIIRAKTLPPPLSSFEPQKKKK